MGKIPGHPWRLPPKYEKWLPKFIGSDGKNVENHIRDFWAFFQLHPINDDVEDLAMKLFSATLHDDARRWYDGLPNASITSMDQLGEIFLRIWNVKEDPEMSLQRIMHINKVESEAVREFHTRLKELSRQIPRTHRPRPQFLIFLYIRAFSGQ